MRSKSDNRGPTSWDVARLAGVSQSTVSLVFAGKDEKRVTAETRLTVLKAADELGYRLNSSARALKLGTQRLIALAVPNVSNPYFAAVLKVISIAAQHEGYATALINAGEDFADAQVLMRSLNAHTFDGLIVWESPWSGEASRVLPATVIVNDGESPAGASLFIPAPAIVATAIDHLAGLGHRRIVRLGFSLSAAPFRARSRAFRNCLAGRGLSYDPHFELEVPFGATASDALTLLMASSDRPTAIVCDDDLLAPLAYRAAAKNGLSVPGDVSVVGIGDIDLARLMEPELTTVAIPAEAVGRAAIDILFRKIRKQETTDAPQTIATHLIERASTGKPG
jgi:DNA-binding LacI/PurR family transcriptional regulator